MDLELNKPVCEKIYAQHRAYNVNGSVQNHFNKLGKELMKEVLSQHNLSEKRIEVSAQTQPKISEFEANSKLLKEIDEKNKYTYFIHGMKHCGDFSNF